mmetsp:Transcript_67264/g.93627  ORF Transcript_67264/g.93627 Transcript_67264/m.93627 type:complete len:217 (+) Transcript_67264:173-823(+)
MTVSIHRILVRLAQGPRLMAGRSAAPDARLSLNLEASDLRIGAAINVCEASILFRESVAAIRCPSEAADVFPGAAGFLAVGDIHHRSSLACLEGQSLTPREEVVRGTLCFTVTCARRATAPDARLTRHFQATIALRARVLATQASVPVVQSAATILCWREAHRRSLIRTGNALHKSLVHIVLLDAGRSAFADRGDALRELCSAAHRRPEITAMQAS